MALQSMDGMIPLVRAALNGDPKYVENVLIWDMARPAGDDPRVAETCAYFIDNSTSTRNVITALNALEIVFAKTDKSRRPKIAAIVRRAFVREDLSVQSAAAGALFRFGGEYREEAYGHFRDLLRHYRGKVSDESLLHAVGYLVRDPDSLQLISDVIEHSTDATAIYEAAEDLGNNPFARTEKPAAPAEVARRAELIRKVVSRKDLKFVMRSRAASLLDKAGRGKDETYRAYLDLLKEPGDLSDPTSSWAYIDVIRKVMRMHRNDSAPLLRNAILEHHDAIVKEYQQSMAGKNADSRQVQSMKAELERIEAIARGAPK